ncbi:MAG TPA: YhjD/YihY/BrkB family envelope integrity protein [Syntrophorhabdaceae bacterium]|nr:YhjD/YihY/BrkB family envelope integrity protein [Syntrophorhabdaceae bacterium]HQM82192.1 YhjD/YihY/BrkB family envelope integrity protein [Syntrophorhabdaceae bacterium]
MTGRIIDFLKAGIWEMSLDGLPPMKARAVRFLRTFLVAVSGFIEHKSIAQASILTYYTVLNIVPLVAVIFAIAKGFSLDKIVEKHILEMAENANWQSEVTEQLLMFSRSFLEQAKGGVIAGIGVVLLFWTVVSILGKIEDSFNTVWGVTRSRTILRKFTDYMATLILTPVLFAIASSLTVLVSGEVGLILNKIKLLGVFSSVIFFLLKFLPYVSLWVLLTVLYTIMPNTKVPLKSAIIGSIVGGTLVQIVQWLYITFQIGVASQGAIYGSLAALPLLFGWLQTSWMIVLFGLEITYAHGHSETYGLQPDYSGVSAASKKIMMLSIFNLIVQRFSAGERPFSAREIAGKLKIPLVLVRELLGNMLKANLVTEVVDEKGSGSCFQPARSIEKFTMQDVIGAYEGAVILSSQISEDTEKISREYKSFSEAITNLPENVKINNL